MSCPKIAMKPPGLIVKKGNGELPAKLPGFRLRKCPQSNVRQCSPEAGMFSARPRNSGTHPVATVPVPGTCIYLAEYPLGAYFIGTVYGCRQSILCIRHQPDSFVVVLHFHDADNGTERFIAHNAHVVSDVREHGRFEVKTFSVGLLSACKQRSSF